MDLEILNEAGTEATYCKTLLLRANHRGLNSYTHRNLSSDGRLSDFRVTPGRILSHDVVAGDDIVVVEFPTHLKRGDTVETTLTLSLKDTFMSRPEETFTLQVDQDIRYARVAIVLPSPPPSATVIYRHSRMEEPGGSPVINGNSIRWVFEKARFQRCIPPGEYEVRWTWPTV